MMKQRSGFLSILAVLVIVSPALAAPWQRLPVPARERLLLRLENGISSKTSRMGDRFTATVLSPLAYEGATVQGHISQLKESGKIKGKTEMVLDFDWIRLRDGRRSPLKAELTEIRQSESVKVVDEEGRVETGGRGKQAIKRGAIGAAIGGVLGGLIGGGKGAVIGVLLGGGAGAGSLIIDGEKELKLESGTEMEIRALRTSGKVTTAEAEESEPAVVGPTEYPSERLPHTRGLVTDVQRELRNLGYQPGPVDGLMGPRTRSALREFQRDNALTVTGQIDRQTADKLGVRY